jgi:urease accessory protein UreF
MPTNKKRPLNGAEDAPRESAVLLGDWAALVEQVGSADALASLAAPGDPFGFGGINNVPALRAFLHRYQRRILVPLELPAIHRAYLHSSRYEIRELIALDQSLAREPQLENFSAASRRIGWSQLRRLRPLREQRLVQRYLRAVERGEAGGWHTIVYGLILALYSLPLRQGLLNYGQRTARGFLNAAGRSLPFSESDSDRLLSELDAGLPAAVEVLLNAAEPAVLAVV